MPEKSPLRGLFNGVPSATDSKRSSSLKGYFSSSQDEEKAHRDLTPPALRIIKRREQLEACAKAESSEHTVPEGSDKPSGQVPDYYEDTDFVDKNITTCKDLPNLKLSSSTIRRLLSAQSLSEIATPENSEEAKEIEKAWGIKQRKISFNCLEDRPADHGLTELFARIRIPSEER